MKPGYGERILGTGIDVAFAGTDRISGDGQAFDNGMRVCLQYRTVHKRAGVAFISVADNVLL